MLKKLTCYSTQGIWLDWLHVFLLALQPDAVASALFVLSSNKILWSGNTKDMRLHQAYTSYRTFCREKKLKVVAPKSIMWRLRKEKVGAYPELTQKHCSGIKFQTTVGLYNALSAAFVLLFISCQLVFLPSVDILFISLLTHTHTRKA